LTKLCVLFKKRVEWCKRHTNIGGILMSRNKRKDTIMTKTEKTIELMSMKKEDVEFSALLADTDDVEALIRSEDADERQLQRMKPITKEPF
jgi:hypothetical protein